MSRILLVEDEATLAETLIMSVKKLEHDCAWAKTIKEAKRLLAQNANTDASFELMILDRNLPDGDGILLLANPLTKNLLTLILSSKSEVDDRVLGLRAGADDYLPKPFSFHELSARLEALFRRRKPEVVPETSEKTLWTLNPDTLQVLAPDGWVELTPLEFKFFSYLRERPDTIISKDRLLKDVWGFRFLPKTRTVDYLITQLRKRIEPNPESPQFLLTVRGAGVKFRM